MTSCLVRRMASCSATTATLLVEVENRGRRRGPEEPRWQGQGRHCRCVRAAHWVQPCAIHQDCKQAVRLGDPAGQVVGKVVQERKQYLVIGTRKSNGMTRWELPSWSINCIGYATASSTSNTAGRPPGAQRCPARDRPGAVGPGAGIKAMMATGRRVPSPPWPGVAVSHQRRPVSTGVTEEWAARISMWGMAASVSPGGVPPKPRRLARCYRLRQARIAMVLRGAHSPGGSPKSLRPGEVTRRGGHQRWQRRRRAARERGCLAPGMATVGRGRRPPPPPPVIRLPNRCRRRCRAGRRTGWAPLRRAARALTMAPSISPLADVAVDPIAHVIGRVAMGEQRAVGQRGIGRGGDDGDSQRTRAALTAWPPSWPRRYCNLAVSTARSSSSTRSPTTVRRSTCRWSRSSSAAWRCSRVTPRSSRRAWPWSSTNWVA